MIQICQNIILTFPNEFIRGDYTDVECLIIENNDYIFKIRELTPHFKWSIISHSNIRKVADYEIRNNKFSINELLEEIHNVILENNSYEDYPAHNMAKIVAKINNYYPNFINENHPIFDFVSYEYTKQITNEIELNFNYFFND